MQIHVVLREWFFAIIHVNPCRSETEQHLLVIELVSAARLSNHPQNWYCLSALAHPLDPLQIVLFLGEVGAHCP